MGAGEAGHFNLEKFDLAFFNDIVKVYRLHDQPGPVSLKGVIDGLQIDFRYSTLTPNLNGLALVVPRTGERKIRVKRTLEPCWRRFIIGHEVGHILQYVQGKLLYSVVEDWAADDSNAWQLRNPHEEEAYAISAFLYIPLDHLREQLYLDTPFEAIAAQLDVPSSAVKLRYQIALETGEFLI